MPLADYLLGLAYLVATLAGVGFASWTVVGRRLPALPAAPRVLALAVVSSAGLISVHLLPLVLGVLAPWSVLACAIVAALAAWRVPSSAAAERTPAPESGPSRVLSAFALAAIAGLGIFVVALGASLVVVPPIGSVDALNFHLPGVARYIQTGSLWQIDQFLPLLFQGTYPHNGDLFLLAAILPWSNDFLAHLAMYPFYVIAGVAVYSIARELDAHRAAAALFAVVFLSVPVVLAPALRDPLVDAVLLAGFGAGVLFLIRHARTGKTAELVLAGLGLGIAFGTKWYGVSSVPVVLVTWALASLVAGRGVRAVLRQGAALTGLVALGGGIWLVRNSVETGNPVSPVEVAPLGLTIFDAPPDVVREGAGFSLFDYLGDPGVWADQIIPSAGRFVGAPGALLLVGILLAAVVLVLIRRSGDRRSVAIPLATLAATVLLLAVYALTPYTAGGPEGDPVLAGPNTRYAGPALLMAAALSAWAVSRLPRAGALGAGLVALVAIADGLRLSGIPPASGFLRAAVALAVVAGAFWGVRWLLGRTRGLERAPRAAILTGLIAVVLVTLGIAGYIDQRRFNDVRYRGTDPTVDWILANAPAERKVGLAGTWTDTGVAPVFPAFGPRLENDVEFVGPRDAELLREYETEGQFAAALERGDYDLLMIGRGRPPEPQAEEELWARSAGYEQVADSERLALYRAPALASE
ncbi:MAG: phospholipid carrier-dependent glycosyltransferase [Thermoleophilaceae bacterium]|nr:phospholipid carrier-dependent glycosyltransferase [Thermoleophilaceae bacterium]